MIPELGHFALILALGIAIVQAVLPLIGVARRIPEWTAIAVPAARAQALFSLVAFGCLTYAFVVNDFSVAYVARNSNLEQPLVYRIAGGWGAHEGSLLLWALLLSLWAVVITWFSRSLPVEFTARVMAVIGFVCIGFLLFMLATSNPFDRLLPAPPNGRELNPLLQDPGLALHPPLLYMGYVGMVVPFAFAIAALLDGRLDAAWVRWSRPWTAVGWTFLTLGIALGSWWAYYELGWGGWWFWDPVENASFMPWLVATGLLHSLAVTEKRGAFKSWTVLLAIFAFSLSLLGTFLVRSGVLVSVHAFATDPSRGVFILAFLGIVIGSSLILYAWRAAAVSGGGSFEFLSRDTMLLVNNVLLTVASATILVGTMYPLFLDALNLGKVSVGPPYFETVFVPVMLPLLFLMGVGPLTHWKKDNILRLYRKLRLAFVLSIIIAVILLLLRRSGLPFMVGVGLSLAIWIILTGAMTIWEQLKNRKSFQERMRSLSMSVMGMTIAHVGVAVFLVGVTLTTAFTQEKDIRMGPGDRLVLSGYTFLFEGVRQLEPDIEADRNYLTNRGTIRIFQDGDEVAILYPEKRIYASQGGNSMTEAAIDAGLARDLYVALGEPVKNGAWSVRVYYKPFIQWLWFGSLLMGIGGLVAAADRRYRMARKLVKSAEHTSPIDEPATEGKSA